MIFGAARTITFYSIPSKNLGSDRIFLKTEAFFKLKIWFFLLQIWPSPIFPPLTFFSNIWGYFFKTTFSLLFKNQKPKKRVLWGLNLNPPFSLTKNQKFQSLLIIATTAESSGLSKRHFHKKKCKDVFSAIFATEVCVEMIQTFGHMCLRDNIADNPQQRWKS